MLQFYKRQLSLSTRTYFGFAAAIIAVRFFFANRLPAFILPNMPHDDGWVISKAYSILNSNWLGSYDQYTLIKGVAAPLMLALSAKIGVPFFELNTLFYCVASFLFIVALHPLHKNSVLSLLVLCIIIFNPLMYSLDTGQRLYRNGMGQWQILLIIGGYIAVYLRHHITLSVMTSWLIPAAFGLAVFVQTREDYNWILPMVFVATILICFKRRREGHLAPLFILIALFPILVTVGSNYVIGKINENVYGMFIVNDRNGGAFSEVARHLNSMSQDIEEEKLYESSLYRDRYITIYNSTIDEALQVSPALQTIEEELRNSIKSWSTSTGNSDTGQVFSDHMLFALRDAAREAGYYNNLQETEEFFNQIAMELDAAFRNGSIDRRGIVLSPMLHHIELHDIIDAVEIFPDAMSQVMRFDNVSTHSIASLGDVQAIRHASLMSGQDTFTDTNQMSGAGWFVSEELESIQIRIVSQNRDFEIYIPTIKSADIFNHFGGHIVQAENARFQYSIQAPQSEGDYILEFLDPGGELITSVPQTRAPHCLSESEFHYCIDQSSSDQSISKFFEPYVERANLISAIYKRFNPYVSLSIPILLVLTIIILSLVNGRLTKVIMPEAFTILGGLGLLLVGYVYIMSIITATTFDARVYTYLAPAYVLNLMFNGVGLLLIADIAKRVVDKCPR